jgi:hypothetical protein
MSDPSPGWSAPEKDADFFRDPEAWIAKMTAREGRWASGKKDEDPGSLDQRPGTKKRRRKARKRRILARWPSGIEKRRPGKQNRRRDGEKRRRARGIRAGLGSLTNEVRQEAGIGGRPPGVGVSTPRRRWESARVTGRSDSTSPRSGPPERAGGPQHPVGQTTQHM